MRADDLKLTIFIVDDDLAVTDSMKADLQQIGTPIEIYSGAERFLESWGGPRPGCVLLDVRMEGISGLELQKVLVKHHSYLPVIITSGHASIQMSVDAMKRGATDFLEKPYSPDVLREVVRDAIEQAAKKWIGWQERTQFESKRANLSPREREVYCLLLRGLENKQIAQLLGISPSTVEKHRLAVVKKMQADNLIQLLSQKFEATGTLEDLDAVDSVNDNA